MRRSVLCLVLLLLAGYHSTVYAVDATVSASWGNATVLAATTLEVQLTTGDNPQIPADALLSIQLNSLFTVAPNATVDDAVLQETLDGNWSVSIDTTATTLAVQRDSGTIVGSGTLLRFKLTGITNPSRAGWRNVGSFNISDQGTSIIPTLQLPAMEVEPGAIWNAQLEFSNLLSGRNTSLEIQMTLAHVVPNDGVIAVYMPCMYGSLPNVTLSSVVGLDGTFTISTKNNVIWIKRDAASGTDSVEMQNVVIELDGIIHPSLEGPMGPTVLLQTLDDVSLVIDQTYVDTSGNLLSPCTCPYGYTCTTSSDPVACTLGQTNNADHSACVPCPKGYQCSPLSNASMACTAGSYSLDGDGECTQCPKGFMCATTTDVPVQCASGTYSPTTGSVECLACGVGYYSTVGSISCTACLRGHACNSSTTSEPVACTPGAYSSVEGAMACSTCPAGHSCVDVTQSPLLCQIGSYSLEGDYLCHACPAGSYCPDQYNAPLSCGAGTYSLGSAAVCTLCGVGVNCSVDAAPVSCAAGYYSINASTPCQLCNAGSYCPSTSLPPAACVQGTYSHSGAVACTACPFGYTCTTSSDPVACTLGQTNNADHSACVPCPKGYQCSPLSNASMACTAGSYSLDGDGECTQCPKGFMCATTTDVPVQCASGTYSPTTGSVECLACGVGYYSTVGSISCTACLRGHACNSSTTSEPVACTPGAYSSVEGAMACSTCPAGHSCVDVTQSPLLCQIGSYSLEGDYLCHACPAGSYCPDQYNAPLSCGAGTYSLGSAAVCTLCGVSVNCSVDAAPVSCAAGYYSINASTPCQLCNAGSYCPSTSLPPAACVQGTYSHSGAVACTACPFGYTCTTSSDPVACTLGQTNNADHSACVPCPKGYQCSPLSNASMACTAGSYSLDGDGECTQCPKGFMCATTTDVPVQCASGTYSPTTGSVECLACPAGKYCPQPSSDPLACPEWYFSGTSSTACTPCSAGMDCSLPFTLPVPCLSGTYSLADASPCLPCPAGFACANATAAPTMCDPGTFSAQGQSKCTQCVAGNYCPQSGQAVLLPCLSGAYAEVGATACTTCPPGMQCPVTTQPIQETCAVGTYSLGGQARCIPCPIGQMCPLVDGSQNAVCAPGWYSSGGAVQCSICPAGYACPNPSTTPPIICSDGYYSLAGATVCTACPPGYACPDPTTKLLVPCAKGTYSTGGASSCTPCPAGFSCAFANSSSVEQCQAGYYSTTGSGSCVECPRGYYCDTPNEMPKNCSLGYYSLRASTSCLACDPGYECPRSDQLPQPCPVGYYSEGAVANCRMCYPGYMCSLASTNPTPPSDACPMGGYCNPPTTFFLCPAGTYGNVTAGESIDQACAPCPEGSYCEMGTTPLTQQICPPGFFCPEGTMRASQNPCPAGTFNLLAGQKSFDVCVTCTAGSYCPTGTSEPQICPQGYYCIEGTRTASQYPCPPGTFSSTPGLVTDSQCLTCPLGSYCPQGSSAATKCPAGTYNPQTGAADQHECLNCPPGWSCPHVGQIDYVDNCTQGHYCPGGTVLATDHPCPAGTYTESIELIRAQDCTICPLRHACLQGTGGETQTMLDCGAGFYCPNGTEYANQFPCLPGTWSSSTSLAAAAECDICPPGQYCQGGKSFIDGNCAPGHYCPLGTYSSTQFPCPSGTYTANTWLFDPSQCDDCPPGYYCPAGSVVPIPCKPGSYTSLNNTKTVGPADAWPACITCPAGFFCVEASVTPSPCGKGNYSTSGSKACSTCQAGYFCNSITTSAVNMYSNALGWSAPGALYGTCYNGTYCPPGSDSEPALETDACPPGYFCPTATPAPIICPAGTYSNLTGQDSMSDCTPTPAGYFSLAGALQPTGVCSPGFYCPLRSTSQMQVPCPARYYLNRTMGQSEDDCALCVSGSYCPIATAYPITCPTGYYCRTGTSSPEPCPIGTYSNATGLRQVDDCLQCPPGMYCDSTALTIPRGLCDPGYYCVSGAYTSAPMNYEATLFGVTNRHTGDQCPQGAYCPLGSSTPTLCPPGTYNNFTGLESVGQCVPCPAGEYCETPGLFLPTGSCHPGYYCIGGAAVPTQMETPAGSFSLVGATAPSPCPPGEYNLYPAQSQCVVCPAGFYCSLSGTITPIVCPTGNYCPQNTSLPVKCLPGTFADVQGLVKIEQCEPCPSGQYCDSYGLSAPRGPCLAGFVCSSASPVANPVNQTYGDLCPVASYCPEGSGSAVPCPVGSYRAAIGGTSLASCSLCPGGKYCSATGLTAPSGSCSQGYYCVSSASTPTPIDNVTGAICSTGFYCPEASSTPLQCSPGMYTATKGQALCDVCPMGLFCARVDVGGQACPTGSYCPQGVVAPIQCPEGSYSNVAGSSTCLACPSGFFCPLSCADYLGNVCPTGHYCPNSTQRATQFPCPPGTFGNQTGLQDLSQCTPAPGGTFIDGYAAVQPTGNCRSGFYCSGGSATSTPAETTATGGPCLPGSNCPEGSAVPIVCDAGSYCSSTNTDEALPCDEGFYCVQGSYTATPTGQNNSLGMIGDVCMRGHYCPPGTSNPIPCLPGTYSETTQNANASYCLPCPPGFVCSTSGIVTPYVKCPPGFFCTGGESTATQLCPKGFECAEGSSDPLPCAAGTFADEQGLAACKLCPERNYCAIGSITPLQCPQGYYCPLQTPSPTQYPCLAGTFGDQPGLASSKECAQCPPGSFCSGLPPTNTTSGGCAPGHYCIGNATTAVPTDGVTGDLCDGGHVCFGGAWVSDPIDGITGRICDPGYYCPEGSFNQIRCPKGTYNNAEKQSSCITCPAGGYCDTNSTTPVPCPLRYYCPEGIEDPVLCPNGTYGHDVGLTNATDCAPCTAGNFCVGGTITASCTAGYYCKVSNDHPNPAMAITNGSNANSTWRTELGGPCPIGYYCPEGVLDPIPCPTNTSRLEMFGISESDCDSCPAGMDCRDGTSTVPCPRGSYCPYSVGAVPCLPGTYNGMTGKANQEDCLSCDAGKLCNRTGILDLADYDCPPGSYCLQGSWEPQPCLAGSFRAISGAKSSDECSQCIGGSYCEAGSTQPTVCSATTYCQPGSGSPLLCPGGSYCPYNTTIPLPCPQGFFCAPAVRSPSICTVGHYCPNETAAQIPCPLGYLGRTTPLDGAYTSLYSSCEACPPGTFGIDANRSHCDECLEGYVCLGATNSSHPTSRNVDNGYPCPPGYYCPAGSSSEIACPSGTYQPNYKASNISLCLPCPENSYQNTVGQPSCLPCSTSAYSGTGATKCTCVGNHRAFQMTDGYCICEPGYEFYDQDMILRSDEDGSVDCQPIVYNRCGSNQVRSDSGACVSASGKACEASCNNSTGTYVASLGVCQCDDQPDLDTICNKKCRDEATQIQVNSTTGELQLYDPVSGEVSSLSDDDLSNLVSQVSCTPGNNCQLQSIALGSTGFSGSYDLPPLISDATLQSRRRLTTSSTSLSITNPMVCLNVGGGLLFDLSVPRSYPIYLKDSMLNTNPSFDYGAFRALATKVIANASTVSAFAFSFTEPGTYVFGNSLNSAAQTIVVVMSTGTSCPTEAPIVPINEKNLITVSAKRRTDDIILAPDWGLIIGLLGGLFGVVIAVIAGLYYFRAKSWTNTAVKSTSGYRAKSKQTNLAMLHSKGTVAVTNTTEVPDGDGGVSGDLQTAEPTKMGMKQLQLGGEGPAKGTAMQYQADLGRWEEEDLDIRELVDRLQFHHEAVAKNFEDQKGDVKQLMQHLQAEATELKRLFVNALVASDLTSSSLDTRSANNGASAETKDELPETLPLSELSGRPRSRSVAGREKFLLENLEHDLQDRETFEHKKAAMLSSVSAGLREIEGWGTQLAELTGAILQEMSSPVDESTPERTSTNERSCLEHARTVLDDLKTLLGSDPMTQTSSSLIHLAEAEKGRREVGNFVLEASQRYFTSRSSAKDSIDHDSNNTIQQLLEMHDDVEKAQNKEDEALFGPLPSLQKFGAALPQVLAALDDLEANFRIELDAIREEQNPVKERAVQAQMQSRLSKLLKEVATGAKKVNGKLEKEAPRTTKLRRGAQHAEAVLSTAVGSAKEQWRAANDEQRTPVVSMSEEEPEAAQSTTLPPSQVSAQEEAAAKLRDDTLFQIKDLLVGLTTLLRTHAVPSVASPERAVAAESRITPTTFVEQRAEAKRNPPEGEPQPSADEYASALDARYPQLSAVEKERLLDDFASDLRKIQSSINIEATRTQAELATRQAATEVLRDAQKVLVQRREQEEADVLRAQHDEEEQSLESQFREEELAIEQEYLEELSSLEMEFGSGGGDEGEGDSVEPLEDMVVDFDTVMDGDESLPHEQNQDEDSDAHVMISRPKTPGDDNADIIAQLNDVYSQAWNDRVQILAMEDALRKEQLNERLRRKRNARQDMTRDDVVDVGAAALTHRDVDELMVQSAERKEALLEDVVKKQDDMDALQQEAVNSAVGRLQEQVEECRRIDYYTDQSPALGADDAVIKLVNAARLTAEEDKAKGEKCIANTESELQQLQNEYDRDFMTLKGEIENERMRLEGKMRDSLAAKRRRRGTKESTPSEGESLDDMAEAGDGSSLEEEEEKLEAELSDFTDQAIKEIRERHFALQQEVEERKAQAAVSVAVAEAQLSYLDKLGREGTNPLDQITTVEPAETPRRRLQLTGELLDALASQIPAQIEQQTQPIFDKLHADYVSACNERRRELEADAAMCRAKLTDKLNRRRHEMKDEKADRMSKRNVASSLSESLGEQERAAIAEIDEGLKTALVALDESGKNVGKTLAKVLASTLHKSGKDVEVRLRECRQQHELALSKLKPGDEERLNGLANVVKDVLDELEDDASQREKTATKSREAIEREIERLKDESTNGMAALTQTLEAEKRRQEQRLHQRMAQRREQQRKQLPVGTSPEQIAEMDDVISKQELVERQRLEDQLEMQAQAAFHEERDKQHQHEDQLAQQLQDACVTEAAAIVAKEAIAQARVDYSTSGVTNTEELAALMRLWKARKPRKASSQEATEMVARKRSVVERLAALAVPAAGSQSSSVRIPDRENVVADTMAAEMEQQIKALSASHLRAWEQRQQEFQAVEARQKAELESRLRRKRDAKLQRTNSGEQGHEDNESESEEALYQQFKAAAIERKFALEADVDADLEHLAAAVQSAGAESTSDIEALLSACHANFETETASLRDALRIQRQAQEEALRQRLMQKRHEKLQELESSGQTASPSALTALDDALKIEETAELHKITETETKHLSALHDRLLNEVGAAFAAADRTAKSRCNEADARLTIKEEELEGIYRDHEEGRRALRESLSVEHRRQQDKLLERMARRRAERLVELKQEHQDDLTEEAVHQAMKALDKEHERERVRLEDTINEQTVQAIRELDGKTSTKEAKLQLETRRLRAEAEAAEAARKALAAAHCAEADRVTREFYACLDGEGSNVDVDALKAQDRRRRLEQRLASKRTRKEKPLPPSALGQSNIAHREEESTPLVGVLSADTLSTVVDDLGGELQRLHDEHDREWGSLKTRLDDEARCRKAQLAERLKRKRLALHNNTNLSPSEREHAEAALDREEERENFAIDASAASANRALALGIQHAREQVADILAEGFVSCSDDIDALLEATRKQHEEGQRKLREALEMDRRKQEQLLQERLRQRRAGRRDGAEPMSTQGTEEAEEAELKRELDEKLNAQEEQAWTALSEREQHEVDAILAPLEAAAGERFDAAELAERRAREELGRLAAENNKYLADLRNNLEAEKQRQQLALQDKLRRKREQRRADGSSISGDEQKEEERQALEALEASFEANLASMEAGAREVRREKETELLAQVCASAASKTAQEAGLMVLDAARLEAERVRAEYEAALASRLQGSAAALAISRDEMAKRLAERKQKRQQVRAQRGPRDKGEVVHAMAKTKPMERVVKEVEDDGSVDREIAVVQEAHARGLKSRREQLEAEATARKNVLAARLEHKRRAAALAADADKTGAELEEALKLEERQELAIIEQDHAAKEAELENEAAREKELLDKTLREADEYGTADIERQLAACKLAHEAESAKLEEALRAERARQELALKQRLASKRQRHKADGGGNDENDSEVETAIDQEVQTAHTELDEQERVARQQLADRQQQELAEVTRRLEQEAVAQRQAAIDLQAAAERELKRLEEEHARERRALQEAMLADQQKREAQLRDKLAKKKASRQAKGSERQQTEEAARAEEAEAIAALQEEIMRNQASVLARELERQEAAMRLASTELQEAAVATAKAAAASRQAQEEAARVTAEFDRHRGETQYLEATEAAQSKQKLADRLAEKKRRQQLKQQHVEQVRQQDTDDGSALKNLQEEAERLRLEAQIEAQLVACRQAHDAEAAKLRESLQAERERQERALQERIARRKEKRVLADAQTSAKVDMKAAEEAERKQQQEEEAALAAALAAQEQAAWETIQHKQEEDLRALQDQKQQQERERAERQQHLAQQEMDRLQDEHERELRALTASLAQEQARQEEKLQQRIAQRRARKQRQEEEAAINRAKAQQSSADVEEEARLAAEREKAEALAQAQAQAEAEAEEKERQEIAARLAQKLEEERVRQRREKEELEAKLAREAEEQAAKRAEALALQLQQQASEMADKMAHEFNTNLRELRETHSADGAAQKARLESRIAAKKARKLRELEEKRELERQRLHTRQQQEAGDAAKAENEREEALAEAARQAVVPVAEETIAEKPTTLDVLSPDEEKAGAIIRAARQQQRDIAAVQQLFTYGLVPSKLSLLGAVELVVGARHERELATQFAKLAAETIESVRQALQAVTQQKAARKAQALQERHGTESTTQDETEIMAKTERMLAQIDSEFTEKLREAEREATDQGEKTKHDAEKRIKERQLREVAYLLAYFDEQHTAALANSPPVVPQGQPLHQQQQSQQPMVTAAQREADDLVAELRSRLELEADERRRELEEEKRLELERLAKDEQDQLLQVETSFAALLVEERAAMTEMLNSRLQALPAAKQKQREAAESEHTRQLQRLTLMLEGRGQQQKARVQARIVQQRALVEDEFRRKAQTIIAAMNQRLVHEKAGLRQKQELLKPRLETTQSTDPEPQQGNTDAPHSAANAEVVQHLEVVLEERLAKIEALVAAFKCNHQDAAPPENTAPKDVSTDEDNTSVTGYRLAVAKAVLEACRFDKRPIQDKQASSALSSCGVLEADTVNASRLVQVPANQLDERMSVRRDFAELLLQSMSTKDEPAAALVVVANFGRGNKGGADYGSFLPRGSDPNGKDTLYLSLVALQELSTGQIAIVMLYALAQARVHTTDVTEPQFISHIYSLLVRCYQGLFTHVQHEQRKTTSAAASSSLTGSLNAVGEASKAVGVADKGGSAHWQGRLLEMEGFLTRMDFQTSASRSSLAIQRSQSSRSRLLSKGESSSGLSVDLWQQEQLQLLQEKLDTAEKLYLQVLRQHEQQTQTVEYWQDLLAEQRDAEYEDDAFDEEDEENEKAQKGDTDAVERRKQREVRAREAQGELDQATQALDTTRKERDELFAQCQQLRDQLNELRGSHTRG